MCCGCWWCNCFGENAGCILACCCAKLWCCKPEDDYDDACQCEQSGCGSMMCCFGNMCCPPLPIMTRLGVAAFEKRVNDISGYWSSWFLIISNFLD